MCEPTVYIPQGMIVSVKESIKALFDGIVYTIRLVTGTQIRREMGWDGDTYMCYQVAGRNGNPETLHCTRTDAVGVMPENAQVFAIVTIKDEDSTILHVGWFMYYGFNEHHMLRALRPILETNKQEARDLAHALRLEGESK